MRKVAASKSSTETQPSSADASNSIVLKIPRVHLAALSFKESSIVLYLGVILVLLSFILGMLTNKVIFLEKQFKDVTSAVAATAPSVVPTPVPPPQFVKVDNGHLSMRGNKNAKVTIVEFSDFQCPFCKKYFDQTDGQIQDNYVKTGKVNFVYRQYPLTSIHPNAQKAAEAAECANEQNQFWNFHDQMFQNQDTWAQQSADDAENAWIGYAGQLGMDTDQFKSCIDNDKYKANVAKDTAAGDKAQVDGTPTFFINGERLTGALPFSSFQKVLDADLKK
ncbi:MAG: DsbA family protein [Candidatus Levyibacteriota bacterium]